MLVLWTQNQSKRYYKIISKFCADLTLQYSTWLVFEFVLIVLSYLSFIHPLLPPVMVIEKAECTLLESMGSGVCLALHPGFITYQLCDLGEVIWLLWASTPLSVKVGYRCYCIPQVAFSTLLLSWLPFIHRECLSAWFPTILSAGITFQIQAMCRSLLGLPLYNCVSGASGFKSSAQRSGLNASYRHRKRQKRAQCRDLGPFRTPSPALLKYVSGNQK